MDGNIEQTRDQLGHPWGTGRHSARGLKHRAAGVALLAGLAGLWGAAGGVPRAAHADLGTTTINGPCYSCALTTPTIKASFFHLDPLTVDISGTDFTPGGAVHIDLIIAYTAYSPTDVLEESAPETVGSMDTTASYTFDLPLGYGQVYHVVGGLFAASPAASSPTCGNFNFWEVATDQVTGRTATSNKGSAWFPCG